MIILLTLIGISAVVRYDLFQAHIAFHRSRYQNEDEVQ